MLAAKKQRGVGFIKVLQAFKRRVAGGGFYQQLLQFFHLRLVGHQLRRGARSIAQAKGDLTGGGEAFGRVFAERAELSRSTRFTRLFNIQLAPFQRLRCQRRDGSVSLLSPWPLPVP